jgi:ankyrin repeat protein
VRELNNSPAGQNWKKLHQKWAASPLHAQIVGAFWELEMAYKPKGRNTNNGEVNKPYLEMVNREDYCNHWTPLHWAVHTGRLNAATVLLRHHADPFTLTPKGRNLVHQAAESGSKEMMAEILSIEADPNGQKLDINWQDDWGETPLHISIYRSSPGCVELLLNCGARCDFQSDGVKQTPLHVVSIAKTETQAQIVDMLATEHAWHLDLRDSRGRPPSFLLVSNPIALAILVERGADLSLRDSEGQTIFHAGCSLNSAASLDHLLRLPELPDGLPLVPDNKGVIPLETALDAGSMACAAVLVQGGYIGDLNEKDNTTLVHRAVILGDADFLEQCFKHPTYRKGIRTKEGWSVQELACHRGVYKDRIQDLIDQYETYSPRR